MNDYIETRISAIPCDTTITDVLAALLAEQGYESFVPDNTGLTAYIKKEDFDRNNLDLIVETFPLAGTKLEIDNKVIVGRDWNSEWEKNYFQPIVVDNKCVIHSSFHSDFPKCEYDIVIDPKMAFGTGHHATTSLMINRLLTTEVKDKSVIDMGTGTGILAILSAMRGASLVTGIEIDPFAQKNAVENVSINRHPEINIILGDASSLTALAPADIFLANINRNIITNDIGAYANAMNPGAHIYLSGFYVADICTVRAAAEKVGLTFLNYTERDNWACIELIK